MSIFLLTTDKNLQLSRNRSICRYMFVLFYLQKISRQIEYLSFGEYLGNILYIIEGSEQNLIFRMFAFLNSTFLVIYEHIVNAFILYDKRWITQLFIVYHWFLLSQTLYIAVKNWNSLSRLFPSITQKPTNKSMRNWLILSAHSIIPLPSRCR